MDLLSPRIIDRLSPVLVDRPTSGYIKVSQRRYSQAMSSVDQPKYEQGRLKQLRLDHIERIEVHAPASSRDILREPTVSASPSGAKQTGGKRHPDFSYRESLPAPMINRKNISFWSIIKSCIGKDLTKIVFPVILNEPLSMVQRLCEYMQHPYLLDKAAKSDNPAERMEYIASFVVSALSCNWMRSGKPFNAMLGETFEYVRPDLGFRYVSEQVSHHPPITALHAEGKGYEFHGSIAPRLSFWGKSIDVTPKGTLVIDLHKYNESYIWQNVHCYVHNLIMGELWMELHGQVTVTCNKSDVRAVINFKEAGWQYKDLHFVEGQIYVGKKLERMIFGSWVKGMYRCIPEEYYRFQKDNERKTRIINEARAEANEHLNENLGLPVMDFNFDIPRQSVMWKAHDLPAHYDQYYNFSKFAMSLNQMPVNEKQLPPTDSRFRPDQRLFENGNAEKAEEEKVRLESQQRSRRQNGTDVKPLWFKLQRLDCTGKEDWVFDKSYWKRDWSLCPKIF